MLSQIPARKQKAGKMGDRKGFLVTFALLVRRWEGKFRKSQSTGKAVNHSIGQIPRKRKRINWLVRNRRKFIKHKGEHDFRKKLTVTKIV